ncbi:MAG: thiamine phosphate synthase [Propionivibrio sp.]|uniref:Thiamine-phosphate synthase n=1 Tax=Candidatus Propionivibrio dominans TaxID=2954373 RepID=A0A9D7FD86_9RHOO|nr:thiamine phosphate synthase [Candidatus Propionivibrio dominans]
MTELKRQSLRGLYAITPDGIERVELLARVQAALRGGVRIVQYRDKQRDAAQQAEIAHALGALCRGYGASFIVNDDLALALAIDADGVHLGADDGDLVAARQALGPGRLLGVSCYADFALARAAVAAGADYVAFGAVCPSPTKPHAQRAPLSLFGRCRDELGVPACAIGGITRDTAPALLAAGADLLAVITDLFEASDIESRARSFQHLFKGEPA